MTIGALAERTGVSASCLRFYERVGLLHPNRSNGNQRRYPAETVPVVNFIQTARQAGLPISLIAQALHPSEDSNDGLTHQGFHDAVQMRMRALSRVRRNFDKIGRQYAAMRNEEPRP